MFVSVIAATSRALVDTGEQRSPKKTPERIAPPVSTGETSMAVPIAAQMTPIVAAVPKEVPVRTEITQLSRKVISRKIEGRIRSAAWQTIKGTVPAARQSAVITPISRKVNRIFQTVATPSQVIFASSRQEKPLCRP